MPRLSTIQLTARFGFGNSSSDFPDDNASIPVGLSWNQNYPNERNPPMKVRMIGLAALCCAFTLIVSFSNSPKSRSQTSKAAPGNGVSQAEQDLLTEINQARANPGVYASYLDG